MHASQSALPECSLIGSDCTGPGFLLDLHRGLPSQGNGFFASQSECPTAVEIRFTASVRATAAPSIACWRDAELLDERVGREIFGELAEIFRPRRLDHHPVLENFASIADPIAHVRGIESMAS